MTNHNPKSVVKAVRMYRDACQNGDPKVVVATYQALQPLFQQQAAYGPLGAAIVEWTGLAVPTRPQSDVVLKAPRLLPWSIALCGTPPWPTNLPAHAIPVSVLELRYLQQAPSGARQALHEEIVKAWERGHLPVEVKDVLRWFDAPEEWEIVSIRAMPSGDVLFSSPASPTSPPLPGSPAPKPSGPAGSESAAAAGTGGGSGATKSTGASTPSPGPAGHATLTEPGLSIEGSLFD